MESGKEFKEKKTAVSNLVYEVTATGSLLILIRKHMGLSTKLSGTPEVTGTYENFPPSRRTV